MLQSPTIQYYGGMIVNDHIFIYLYDNYAITNCLLVRSIEIVRFHYLAIYIYSPKIGKLPFECKEILYLS